MSHHPGPSLTVNVDVANPGQFFACCGLLELTHRLWPGAEGWFDTENGCFVVICKDPTALMEGLFCKLRECPISGLSEQEQRERDSLEAERRKMKGEGQEFPPDKEERLKELGTEAREGAIRLEQPFTLILNWWQTADEDTAMPKTWAGRQEIHKVARAAQDALVAIAELTKPFDHGCVLRMPQEYRRAKSDHKKSVEPFYFDARRFAHSLDTGFSLDAQDAETAAHPAVELLSLIGLQRFRPVPAPVPWSFDYWAWSRPLTAPVAAGVVTGVVPTGAQKGYRFPLRFRDDQKRYKAFGFATPIGDEHE